MQAVEQQDGRFLEKDRRSGFWYVVPYKRSVDKTSQGLREKDPEERGDSKASSGKKTNVPVGFRGTSKAAPNLDDLAQVAIAHANRMEGGPDSVSASPLNNKKTAPASAAKVRTKQAAPKKQPSPASASKRLSPATAQQKQPPKRLSPSTGQQKKRLSPAHLQQAKRVRTEIPPAAAHVAQDGQAAAAGQLEANNYDDSAPLPPDMEVRTSSMFRFLKHTRLLPGTSSTAQPQVQQQQPPLKSAMKKPPPSSQQQQLQQKQFQLQNQQQVDHMREQARRMQQMQQQQHKKPPFQQQYAQYAAGTYPKYSSSAAPAASSANQASYMTQYPQQQLQTQQNNDDAAPSLTRFTSQVSDWLNSFWPVEQVAQQRGQQSSVPHVQNTAARISQPNSATEAVATAASVPARLNQAMAATAAASLPQNSVPAKPELVKEAPKPSKSSRKRKSSSMPPLPYGFDGGIDDTSKNNGAAYQIPMDAMPTELEQSVSSTLLKLAASPSKLFSGLTSFFGDPGETSMMTATTTTGQQQSEGQSMKKQAAASIPSPPAGQVPPQAAGKSKPSKSSLLDDYDETPMEARLRTVAWK